MPQISLMNVKDLQCNFYQKKLCGSVAIKNERERKLY